VCRSAVLTGSPVPKPIKSPVKSPSLQTCSAEEQTDYTGNDICYDPNCPRSSTSAGCCNLCASTSGCRAFTWTNYAGGTCWLKSGKSGSTACSGCRSAVLTGSPPVKKPALPPAKPVVKPKPTKPVVKPKPAKPVVKPGITKPAPKPAASPSSISNCGPVIIATMTSYDNLSGDDSHPGCFNDYCGTTPAFLEAVPVVAIHQKNWALDKYHYIEITRSSNGAVGIAQSWDLCADTDCGGCCTTNAQAFGGNYLVDVERRTLQRLFGLSTWDQTWEKVAVRVCNSFDPAPIASKYGLKK